MEIKIHPVCDQNKKKQECKQKCKLNGRMTLQQYLQSTNLKRRIQSRSRSKQSCAKGNLLNLGNQETLAQASIPTTEFHKLNQQWKQLKIFNTWIGQLKQMVRQYIKNDQHYIQVVRVMEKMTQFVRSEVQAVRKDNLLLQSYLVMEASYWLPENQAANSAEKDTHRLSNYLKTVLNSRSQLFASPLKTLIINEDIGIETEQNIRSDNPKMLTQAKTSNNDQQQTHQHQQSHTKTSYFDHCHSKDTNKNKQRYIYSFKDKIQQRTKSSKHPKQVTFSNNKKQDPIIKHFQLQQISVRHPLPQPCLLGVQGSCYQEVPRLSLMSRYGQKRHQSSQGHSYLQVDYGLDQKQCGTKKMKVSLTSTKEDNNVSYPVFFKENLQFVSNKPPLRDRKQKAHHFVATNSPYEDFQMIKHVEQDRTNQKIRINEMLAKQNQRNTLNQCDTPISSRNSPNMVTLQTPSTLRRRQNDQIITSCVQKQKLSKQYIHSKQIVNNINERSRSSQPWVYSSSTSERHSSVNRNKQNIMKRYEMLKNEHK